MPRTLALCLIAALLPAPAFADDPITMQFRNDSSRAANISGVYEIRNGVAIDENLGSSDPFQPGETINLELTIDGCMTVEISGWLGVYPETDREEIYGKTDLCKNRLMILHD